MRSIRVKHPFVPRRAARFQPKSKRKGPAKGQPGLLGLARHLFWSWWLWIAAAAALEIMDHWTAAVVFASTGFCFYLLTPQEHVPRYGLEPAFPVQSHEFVASIVGCVGVPFVKNNRVTVLNNGDEFYPSMLEAIAGAQKTVTMEAYIFWKGEIGLRFAQTLAERSHAGVTVKLLLDAVGSSTIGEEIEKILKDAGCEVAWYNPLRLRTIGRLNNRTHRKSLIIDGRISFTGGAGIADHWLGNAEHAGHWRDVQIRVEGPGATGLQTGFAQNWLDTTGELVSGDGFFPPPDSAGTMSSQTILSTPESGSSNVRIMYYMSIISAQKSIYISNPYFIPDDASIEILIDAKKRGVDVKIMVAGVHNDMRISRYSGIHLYGKLLEAGVEIYEYNRTMMHQKTMVVDNVWSTVGTTNFDNRSFALHEESNVCFYDRRMAERLEAIFNDDLKACDRVTYQAWRRRGLKTRIFGALCVFLKEQT